MTTPAPVTPTLSIAADKGTYNVGDTLTLTADYSDSSVAPVTLHITASASDAQGNTVNAEVDVTVNTQAQQAMQIGVSDDFGDQYTQVSNDAGVAVLTTVIGTPPGGTVRVIALTITAVVTDAAGNTARASVTVDVLSGAEAARFGWFGRDDAAGADVRPEQLGA